MYRAARFFLMENYDRIRLHLDGFGDFSLYLLAVFVKVIMLNKILSYINLFFEHSENLTHPSDALRVIQFYRNIDQPMELN